MRTGVANAPLHGGYCPPWLFKKMRYLGASIIEAIVVEYGTQEVLRRLSDPVWFQSLGSVLGFDWHSSGLTTVLCGALKEGLQDAQGEMGLFLVGGKGKASRKTPTEIVEAGDRYGLSNELTQLQQTSRTVAKVDSAAVQDGYQLYHHFLVFDAAGNWAVVQQGMNDGNRYARRYHWLSEQVTDFTNEPHQAVCGSMEQKVLNLVSGHNQATRTASVEILQEKPEEVKRVYQAVADQQAGKRKPTSEQLDLFTYADEPSPGDDSKAKGSAGTILTMPAHHPIPSARHLDKVLYHMYDIPPESYQGLLETKGIGPSTLRALAMVSEVTHGAEPAFRDPVRYAFAHGGKDNYPFPVNREDIDHSLSVLKTTVDKAKMGDRDKMQAQRRLAKQAKALRGS